MLAAKLISPPRQALASGYLGLLEYQARPSYLMGPAIMASSKTPQDSSTRSYPAIHSPPKRKRENSSEDQGSSNGGHEQSEKNIRQFHELLRDILEILKT